MFAAFTQVIEGVHGVNPVVEQAGGREFKSQECQNTQKNRIVEMLALVCYSI
jgi:hypothetical protein